MYIYIYLRAGTPPQGRRYKTCFCCSCGFLCGCCGCGYWCCGLLFVVSCLTLVASFTQLREWDPLKQRDDNSKFQMISKQVLCKFLSWVSLYGAECSPRMSPTSSWLKVQEDTSSISVRLNWWKTTGPQVYSQIDHISPGHLKNIRSHSFCWWPLISVFIHALHPSPLKSNLCMNPKRYWKGFIHHARTTWLWKALPLVLRLHCLSNRQKYFSGERGEKLYSCTPELEDDLERTPPRLHLFECVSLGLGTLVWQTRFFPIKAL